MHTVKPSVLEHMIKKLPLCIVKRTIPIREWNTHTGIHISPNDFSLNGDDGIITEGEYWKAGYDDTRWFETTLTLPKTLRDEKLYLRLELGGEALVRINGTIHGAVSSSQAGGWVYRNDIFLDFPEDGILNISVEATVCCGSFCDTAIHGGKFMEYRVGACGVVAVDELAERYYFTIKNTYDSIKHIDDDVIRERVYFAVDDSLHTICHDMGYAKLRESLPEAMAVLEKGLSDIPYGKRGKVLMCGHSHLDVAWLWTVKEITRKTARTFSNNLELMERYPDFIFAQSQAVVYQFVKDYYPDIFEKVKEKVKNGQWIITGNTWVEADTNIASGESLVRQLLYGREFFLNEFGVCSDIYWLPDCFGFSRALPQIIKRSGMKYFLTSKLANNDTNLFPDTIFRWRAHSGDEILAYFQNVHYSGEFTPDYIRACRTRNLQKAVCDTSFGMFGYGDGGGGCTYAMLENYHAIANTPGMPVTECASPEEFFATADEHFSDYPIWDDELYYENHRGTYTSQHFVKKSNRQGEYLLRNAELFSVLAEKYTSLPFNTEDINSAWKLLLINQFHDILPGTSIHEVYVNTRKEYDEMFRLGDSVINTALEALTQHVDTAAGDIIAWNPNPWEYRGQLSVDGNRCKAVIPAFGYSVIDHSQLPQATVSITESCIENEFLRVEFDESGLLTSIFDKKERRETLDGKGNIITVYQDKPVHESAWNMELDMRKHAVPLTNADEFSIYEDKGTNASFRIVRTFNNSIITQIISLSAGDDTLRFDTEIDMRENEKTFKTAFPVAIRSTRATYDAAHGFIERPTHRNTSYDQAKFECCAHKWADLSEGNYGISILNDCKYGYAIYDNVIELTLLRSPDCPDATADREVVNFTYIYYPHSGSPFTAQTVRKANELNNPPLLVRKKGNIVDAPRIHSFFSADCDNIVFDALKRAQDGNGYILRFYETSGFRGEVTVRLPFTAAAVKECNLMEVDEHEIETDGHYVSLFVKPNEVITLRILD